MVKKEEQEIIDKRLEETLAEMDASPRQQEAAEAAEEPKRTPKPRQWDRENPSFSFRIRPEDNDRIGELAEVLAVTRDALAAGLMRTALDAVDEGRLTLEVEREPVQKRDRLGRLRTSVNLTVRGTWAKSAE